jgi:hypothetical protein
MRQGKPKERRRSSRAMSSGSLPFHVGGELRSFRSHVVPCLEGRTLGVVRLAQRPEKMRAKRLKTCGADQGYSS